MSDLLDDIMKAISENGVCVRFESVAENSCEDETVIVKKFSHLDFSEHDKAFEDKIAELDEKYLCMIKTAEQHQDARMFYKKENESLKQHIAELESKETVDLPFDPLECANYLINATYERETNGIERAFHNLPDKVNSDRYTVDDLEQIAEHLLVYCKHNKESE